jgi:hypothetical protein
VDLGSALVKLKTKEIAAYRAQCVLDQLGVCPLCESHLALSDAVLDHRHSDGQVRQAIHRLCNTFLGKIENNVVRNRISTRQLQSILKNYEAYVSQSSGVLHPTHKTAEQRAETAKRRAKRRRVAKKQQNTHTKL